MSIANTAMLISLNIRSWTAEAKDRKVTEDIADTHGVVSSVGRYTKRLISERAIQQIQKIASASRETHYRLTLPWANDGARILPAALFDDYAHKMTVYKREYRDQVDAFIADYDALIEEAKRRLNGMFNEDDYPPVGRIRERFDFNLNITQIPEAKDFRVGLDADDVAKIKASIEDNTKRAIADAMSSAWDRLKDVVEHMAERLGTYQGGRKGSFRDTLVDNARDLVKILPKLNIMNDPNLDLMVREVEAKLCRYDASVLREDATLRAQIHDEAASVFAKLQAFGG